MKTSEDLKKELQKAEQEVISISKEIRARQLEEEKRLINELPAGFTLEFKGYSGGPGGFWRLICKGKVIASVSEYTRDAAARLELAKKALDYYRVAKIIYEEAEDDYGK